MPDQRVVVDLDFCIQGAQCAGSVQSKRVDLREQAIVVMEQREELLDDGPELSGKIRLQAGPVDQVLQSEGLDADGGIDPYLHDLLGMPGHGFVDIDAALRREDQDRLFSFPVKDDAQVELAPYILLFRQEEGGGALPAETQPENFRRGRDELALAASRLHAASFSPSPCLDLRLHDNRVGKRRRARCKLLIR